MAITSFHVSVPGLPDAVDLPAKTPPKVAASHAGVKYFAASFFTSGLVWIKQGKQSAIQKIASQAKPQSRSQPLSRPHHSRPRSGKAVPSIRCAEFPQAGKFPRPAARQRLKAAETCQPIIHSDKTA